jgi:hypothetical protein
VTALQNSPQTVLELESREVISQGIKEEARRLVEKLADDATWEDLMYEVYVIQTIEAGLEDSRAGRVIDPRDVRARFGLPR